MVVAGLFCLLCAVSVLHADLVEDLFDEGNWRLCERECQRALQAGQEPRERFLLLKALCGINRDLPDESSIRQLDTVLLVADSDEIVARAAYERGHLLWRNGRRSQALDAFAEAFNVTTNRDLFLHAGCSAFLLMEDAPVLKREHSALIDQINTTRSQWYGALFADCRMREVRDGREKRSGLIIRFYRHWIRPAIGSRCVLEPSCSEYFHRAECQHGVLAFPMTADRFVREPGVSNAKQNPVIKSNGRIRYRDPLSDHDFWMEKK